MKIITPHIGEDHENFLMVSPKKEVVKTDKIALIDADFIKYFVCNAIKKDIEKKKAVIYENIVHKYTKEYINLILDSFDAPGCIFCFSGSSDMTFRNSIAFDKKYKGNRVYTPLYEGELEDKTTCIKYIQERYPTLLYKDLEADDIISMLQDEETFVYSRDKDLLQIPGTHYDLETGHFVEMTKRDSFAFLMNQMITGDTVDNITGIKGIGSVGAQKLLTNQFAKDALMTVLNTYLDKNGLFNGIDLFVESWNLLRLRNNRGDYFLSKYMGAFDVLKMVKLMVRKNG